MLSMVDPRLPLVSCQAIRFANTSPSPTAMRLSWPQDVQTHFQALVMSGAPGSIPYITLVAVRRSRDGRKIWLAAAAARTKPSVLSLNYKP